MRHLRYTVITVLSFLMSFANLANASKITPTEGQAIYKSPSTVEDVLVVAPPNQAGISVNYFSEFVVDDKALKLVNSPVNRGDGYDDAAMLVVIIADDISISNQVELLGPASDILFLSKKSNGQISCDNCSFENFYRITLAAANTESTFPTSTGLIGKLSTTPSGEVAINNLSARGALAVETLAKTVTLDGLIDTHDRAEAEGLANINGYSQNQNGNFTIGTGSVNLMLGQMEWDYDTQTIRKVTPADSSVALNGSIRSVEVKVSSVNPLELNTQVDTKVDLLSTTQYKGLSFLPNESIHIVDFGEGITYLNNRLVSEGSISTSSAGSINILNGKSSIEARQIKLIAVKKFFNQEKITADDIEIAGDSFVNRGYIDSDGDISIWANKNVVNEFGGEILGQRIKLHSDLGVVRNGSRTPYMDSLSGIDRLMIFDSESIESTDLQYLGTYYRDGVDIDLTDKSRADKTHAFITGNEIEIVASGFENINPFWKVLEDEELNLHIKARLEGLNIDDLWSYTGFLLKLRYKVREGEVDLPVDDAYEEVDSVLRFLSQVFVNAETSLRIVASNYVVNSSAFMRVNSSFSELSVNTKSFINERFLNLHGLSRSSFYAESSSIIDPPVKEEIDARSFTFSPAGTILAMGDFRLNAEVGMLNENSYFEVYGNAEFNAPSVNNIGFKTSLYRSENTIDRIKCNYSADMLCPLPLPYIKGRKVSFTELEEYESLFYVHGDALGNGETKLKTETASVMDYFINMLIDDGRITEEDIKSEGDRFFEQLSSFAGSLYFSLNEFVEGLDWWSE